MTTETCTLVSDWIIGKLSIPLPANVLRSVFALRQLDDLWAQCSAQKGPICVRLLTCLNASFACDEAEQRLIPRTGPAIVMANHPHGLLDGMLAWSLLLNIRSDVKIVTTSLLGFQAELAERLIAVDVFGGKAAVASNAKALRQMIRWLRGGGLLLVFPSGSVSRFGFANMNVTDGLWSPHFVALAQHTSAKVVPLFISGCNSAPFQVMSLVNGGLGTAMLPRELTKRRNTQVLIRVGCPIKTEALARFSSRREATAFVRLRTYLLDGRSRRQTVAARSPGQSVEDPVQTGLLIRDIAMLPASAVLHTTEEYSVYLSYAAAIPNVLREIGRLREIAFRAEGEGTGRAIDLDPFDEYYCHLFVWHNHRQEVAGAYRLGLSDEILPRLGPSGFYTSTLFRFPDSWWGRIAPAIELGRSFIRPELQRSYGPLLALWRGVGAFLGRCPQYRYLFGPVSISGRYKSASKQLIASYLRPAMDRSWSAAIFPHTPPYADSKLKRALEEQPLHLLDVDDIDSMIRDLEPDRSGLPVLLRHYLNLGGRVLAFNEDARFSAVVDGLLLIDLLNADTRRLDRFLGKGVIDRIAACNGRANARP